MRKWNTAVVVIAVGAVALAQQAAGPPTPFGDPQRRAKLATAFADVDRILTEYATIGRMRRAPPGASSSTASSHTRARSGVRDVASKAPVDADTVFRIASMTKSFTAMSILKLRDEGKLSLDDPAEQYVPELKTLALPDDRLAADHDPPSAVALGRLSRRQSVGRSAALARPTRSCPRMIRSGIPFSNAPGIAYEYSNYGFAILGRIVSRVSGSRTTSTSPTNILKPLGMTSTTLASVEGGGRIGWRIGYRWEDEQWKEEPPLPHGSFGSMGGMLTSIRDLSRYVVGVPRGVAAA